MRIKVLFIFAAILCFIQLGFGQDLPPGTEVSAAYTLGVGDKVTVKVLGEPQFDFEANVDESGQILVPFVKQTIVANCMTENDLGLEVAKKLSFYLKDPRINLQVTDRKSRPPVAVYGEVKTPLQITLTRKATLRELIAFVGGEGEKASGVIQVLRTRPFSLCNDALADAWKAEEKNSVPSRTFSMFSVQRGAPDSNPQIYPGDIIIFRKSSPVWVIGQVMALKELSIGEKGLSLVEAVAQAGGFAPRAKTKDIRIRRLKPDSREREIIAVNYQLIRDGKQKDVMLQPEDIIEIDKSPKSVAETVLELVTGTARSFTNVLPQRVMY
jgi:protein involved in polysaccharide export with SLBB domain